MERTRCLMVLVFVLVFGLTAGTANALLVADEAFDYAVGQDLTDQDGGIGWTGPWSPDPEHGGTATIASGSLLHPTIAMPAGVGNHVLTGTSGEAMIDRTMSSPILDEGGPGQAWISYLFTIETEAIDGDNWRSIDMFGGPGWALYITGIGQPFGAGTFGFFNVDSGVPITVGQVYWIVVKIEFSGDGADDDVYLWVDPYPGLEPSTSSPTVSTTTSSADDGLNRIMIVSMGPGRWDRIRIADTWIDAFGFSPSLAASPQPRDQEINVNPALALLQWGAPTEACDPLYDVYFGTDPDLIVGTVQLEDDTANTSTAPPAMAIDTQYYWRVDVEDLCSYAITAIAGPNETFGPPVGQVRATVDPNHAGGIKAGNYVTISDTTDYNGTHLVTNVSDNTHFDFEHAFTSNQTGNVEAIITRLKSRSEHDCLPRRASRW